MRGLMEPARVGGASPLGVVVVVVVVAIECRRVVVGFVFVAETWSVIRDPGGDEGQVGLLDSLLDRLGRRVGR